jgi:hypothetical protein
VSEAEAAAPAGRVERPLAIWFGLLAPPIAWGARLLLAYGAEDLVCSTGSSSTDVFGIPYRAFAIGESIVMLAVAVAAGLAAWGAWKRFRDAAAPNRPGWMALSGVFSAAVFSLLIVTESIPLFVLDVCASAL